MKRKKRKWDNPLTDFLGDLIGDILIGILWGIVKFFFRGIVHFIKFLF